MKFNEHLTSAQSLLRLSHRKGLPSVGKDECIVVDLTAGTVSASKLSSLDAKARELIEKFSYTETPPKGCIHVMSKCDSLALVLSVLPERGIYAVRDPRVDPGARNV